MIHDKDNALMDYMKMIKESWTWARMTEEERARCTKALCSSHIKGTWEQRFEQLHDVHRAFLYGLDYKPIGWRETEEVPGF